MKTLIAIIASFAVGSPAWASEDRPPAPFHPVGLWHLEAQEYSATIDFSGTGMCLVTYLRRGYVEHRGACYWEASGATVNIHPREVGPLTPVTLTAASDAVLEFASDNRVVFHRRSWREH